MVSPSQQPAWQQPPRRPRFFVAVDRFWQRITNGLELNQLWAQFKADARASYRLYQHDVAARSPEEPRRHRFLHTAQQLSWAILEKLTPARRVLLLLGVILLVIPGGGFEYQNGAGHVQIAQFDFRFYGGILILLVLMLEIADRVVMKRDLEIARDIQKWLLPATPPEIAGLDIAFSTRPTNTVAGDFYDVFPRPSSTGENKFIIAVADVAGKSIPAALLTATFQASLRTLAPTASSLEDLVKGMNHYACTNSQSGLRFTTAFLSEFDPTSRTLSYINAGHNPPVLRGSSGTIERLTRGGLPLGIKSDAPYDVGRVVLKRNDWLFIFTDGLVEAVNARDEEYGEQRMLEVIDVSASLSASDLLRRMMFNLDAFVGETPQHDDVTCLVIKVNA
jgi:phosphoserine phosphatase RsbU/P